MGDWIGMSFLDLGEEADKWFVPLGCTVLISWSSSVVKMMLGNLAVLYWEGFGKTALVRFARVKTAPAACPFHVSTLGAKNSLMRNSEKAKPGQPCVTLFGYLTFPVYVLLSCSQLNTVMEFAAGLKHACSHRVYYSAKS